MPSIETYELVLSAVAACEDKKAEDIRILALDPTESGLSDYFLICNGTNERQNVAITDEIEIRLKREFGIYPNSVEGRRQGEWVLMDYVDFIVHVFSAEKRQYYGLERLRKSATTVSAADLDAELKTQIRTTREPVRAGRKSPEPASLPAAPSAKQTTAKKKAVPAKVTNAVAKKGLRKAASSPARRSSADVPATPRKSAAKKAAQNTNK